ncbi:hypothetical protein [Halapricum desulfuricans]|uniref:Uncharacterized protein n=1 Tax=Halapricum desulfuricans TaxID=2841257 RepID=A0A897MV89_9EURY|nr:hypothetical protein [Halapricum desulfuricans]QSG04482.1 hypothetical protein HSR121_0121 [Halapricum desulfuricans]
MHRRSLTAVGGGTVLISLLLAASLLAGAGASAPVFAALALWALGGAGWIAAGEDLDVAGLAWYQLVGIGTALVGGGMAVLGAWTLSAGDSVLGGAQLALAAVFAIQARNHYRGGNITDVIDAG